MTDTREVDDFVMVERCDERTEPVEPPRTSLCAPTCADRPSWWEPALHGEFVAPAARPILVLEARPLVERDR